MGFTVDIKGNASHLDKTLKGVEKSLSNLGSVATTGLKSLAGIGVAGGAAITAFIVSSSNAASNIESLTMQFETLLGGADAAGKRMEEITKFAASTPFEISELAATSKLLQTMGGTMLATGDGLRMVGDAASIAGQPLSEVGLHIGRVFSAMASGNSAGESVARLQELGLITGDYKRELEALAAAQKKGTAPILSQSQSLAKLQGMLKGTSGAMERLAATTEGKLSNMKDNVSQLQVAFGTGFNDGLKNALDATNTFLPQLESKFATAGSMLGGAITEAINGNAEQLAAAGALLGEIVFNGFEAFYLKSMDELLAGAQNNIGNKEANAMKSMVNKLSNKMGRGDVFSKGEMGNKAEAAPLSSYMQTAIENVQGSSSLGKLQDAQMKRDIAAGIKTGITSSMSEEVKKGILDAWAKQPQGAKFSN